jgi:hypothetical protein
MATRPFVKAPWMQTAEKLFLPEFEDPKDFYKAYSEPTDVYKELARRVVAASVHPRVQITAVISEEIYLPTIVDSQLDQVVEGAAYRVMSMAYGLDAANANTEQLDILTSLYTRKVGDELTKGNS